MTRRVDISDRLIHFTSGQDDEDAYQNLKNIIDDHYLIGSVRKIKGDFLCVCFTEAPLEALSSGLVNDRGNDRYSLFGIIFDKNWIFQQGGRPVIYQPDDEYDLLPESIKWRHMRYEPTGAKPVDFSWEREWRLHTERFPFDPSVAGIVFPDRDWAERYLAEHQLEQDIRVREYAQALDDELIAEGFREDSLWRVFTLR